MSSPVITIQSDEPVERAVRLMAQKGLKRLPAVDREGRREGMLSRVDVLEAMVHHGPPGLPHLPEQVELTGQVLVGQATLHEIPTVTPDTPLRAVLELLDPATQRVAVVSPEGRLVGMISDRDLLSVFPAHGGASFTAYVTRWDAGGGTRVRSAPSSSSRRAR